MNLPLPLSFTPTPTPTLSLSLTLLTYLLTFRAQLVSLPASLGGGSREDWKAPEVARSEDDGSWVVTCRGGM